MFLFLCCHLFHDLISERSARINSLRNQSQKTVWIRCNLSSLTIDETCFGQLEAADVAEVEVIEPAKGLERAHLDLLILLTVQSLVEGSADYVNSLLQFCALIWSGKIEYSKKFSNAMTTLNYFIWNDVCFELALQKVKIKL